MNQREIMEALLSGKKIRSAEWSENSYIYLVKEPGYIVDQDGVLDFVEVDERLKFEIYQEPKKTSGKISLEHERR